ncbi:hypothetical protein MTR_0177s0050 [Medicago truncatula]|uniref:Transposase MuDR plant domain-containing protein n=1 Tax=Medicago truncatula TaxID=3880 RepID=A0A072TGH4_MEDTR|nr:hypothetical protein MTR_0177s0050 [Medicago truncatula]
MAFTTVFFVKGFFASENGMKYEGGVTHIEGIVKELDKDPGSFRMWWKPTTISLYAGLIKIGDDKDASIISKYVVEHNARVEIYVEYITEVKATANYHVCLDHEKSVKDKKGKGVAIPSYESGSDADYEAGCDSVDSQYSRLDDSEEERVLGLDDGFEEELVEFAGEGTSRARKSDVHTSNGADDGNDVDDGNDYEDNNSNENYYVSEELGSASDSGGDGCVEVRSKYPKFRSEDLTKTFKFIVDVVLEHNVLNGKQVKFRKNDAVRVRVICKSFDICNYTEFVSRVAGTHTFRVKTLSQKHTCGRVFYNKNAKSDWLAKVIFEGMKSSKRLQINDVVTEVRTKYSTGITFSTAFKARQIARKLVEGDSVKHYSLLWSYSEDLQRACPRNICKLHIERPAPTLKDLINNLISEN